MEQRSEEWFAARKGKITGSRIGAILGMNPYKSRADCMRDMVREWHGAPSEFTGNAATDHGEAMEPTAFAFYRKNLPAEAADVEEVGYKSHPEHEFLGASPDGIHVMHEGENIRMGLEIKCPYYAKTTYSIFDPKKASYWAQMQLVMQVWGLDCMDFLCFFSEDNYLLETLDRDDEWFAKVLPELEKFHAEFQAIVKSKKKSEPFLRDGDPEVDDARIEELEKLWAKIAANRERMKPTEDLFKRLKADLSEEYGVGTNGRVRFATQTKKGAVDYAKLVKDLGIEKMLQEQGKSLDDYRKADTTSIIVEAAR